MSKSPLLHFIAMKSKSRVLRIILSSFMLLGNCYFYGIGFATNFIIEKREPIQDPSEAKTHLVITATSDLHGWISTEALFPEKRVRGFAYVIPLIKKLRQTYPNLILLDAGDTLQGSPTSYYFTYVSKRKSPLPIIQLMNQQRYDAVALGNHDLEIPSQVMKYNLQQSNFHWLAANLIQLDMAPQKAALLSPYHIIERNGVRIGILGLLTPGTSMWVNPDHLKGIKLENMVEAAKKWVAILRNKERVDVLIGLFHSGHNFKYDQFAALNQKVELPNAAGVIADQIEGFDLIISGHAHRTYPRKKISVLKNFRTPLVSPGAWGNGVSLIQIFLKKQKKQWAISQMQVEFIPSKSSDSEINLSSGHSSASPEILGPPSASRHSVVPTECCSEELNQVQNYLNAPTQVKFYTIPDKNQFYECGADLSHHVTRAIAKNLLSLSLLPGRWRWHSITQDDIGKPVKRLHLFRWMPYDNTLIQANLFGRQIKILLEPYLRLKKGRKYIYNSLLAPGGLRLKLENDNSVMMQLKESNTSILPDELYPVWMTNYHWNGGGGRMGKALIHASQKMRSSQNTLRDLVFEHLQNHPNDLPDQCKFFLQTISPLL